jgi:hypothetical protein
MNSHSSRWKRLCQGQKYMHRSHRRRREHTRLGACDLGLHPSLSLQRHIIFWKENFPFICNIPAINNRAWIWIRVQLILKPGLLLPYPTTNVASSASLRGSLVKTSVRTAGPKSIGNYSLGLIPPPILKAIHSTLFDLLPPETFVSYYLCGTQIFHLSHWIIFYGLDIISHSL